MDYQYIFLDVLLEFILNRLSIYFILHGYLDVCGISILLNLKSQLLLLRLYVSSSIFSSNSSECYSFYYYYYYISINVLLLNGFLFAFTTDYIPLRIFILHILFTTLYTLFTYFNYYYSTISSFNIFFYSHFPQYFLNNFLGVTYMNSGIESLYSVNPPFSSIIVVISSNPSATANIRGVFPSGPSISI